MSQSIYPCLWFDSQAQEAADHYCRVFWAAKILQATPMATTFEAGGTKFLALNGGPYHKPSPAVSYYVHCGNRERLEQLFAALSEGGEVLMPLGRYEWAEQYAWVADRFGVNWQMDSDDVPTSQKIIPTLLLVNDKKTRVKEAITCYTDAFPNAQVLLESPHPSQAGMPKGALLFAQVKLDGFLLNVMSSAAQHDFDFTPGNSLVVECEDQTQIDHYWAALGQGGHYDRCGWLADKFGVSWQIVPTILSSLMSDPERAPRVVEAFMAMQKFDIEALVNA